MSIWSQLQASQQPIFILAPMEDVTDTVFRQIITKTAKPDLFFTEFVSVDGLQSAGRESLLPKLAVAEHEKPVIAQIWGLKPENFEQTAREIQDMGFAGIDLNMGCPVPKIIKNGACSALANNHDLAHEIIEATKRGAGDLPVSVKCRKGFGKADPDWIRFLLGHDLAALTIHGRTTKEQSKPPCDWDFIAQAVQWRDEIAPNTVLNGNGDVLSHAQGVELAARTGVDGIMIGRGIFQDPYAFAPQSPWQAMATPEKLELYKEHIQLFLDFYGNKKNPASLKKFAKVYMNGFDNASELRSAAMETQSAEELLAVIDGAIRTAPSERG